LEALKSLEEEEKSGTNTALLSVGKISKPLVQRGAKSAKSPSPSPDGEGTPGVNTIDAKPKEARRTVVTTRDQLTEVVADLKGVNLVALDLETTGLDPREDCVRLLSLANRDATYIVDCQSVDPAELLPTLRHTTLVAHNALFDLGFLASLGFVPGAVAAAQGTTQGGRFLE
jgi:uncharacterized protein YprB with RNaseH-like and TPR domain